MIEEDLDEALERVSAAEGISKAAVIRRSVRRAIVPLPDMRRDPLSKMTGADAFDPSNIDSTVYG